jgi:hypothetical protein
MYWDPWRIVHVISGLPCPDDFFDAKGKKKELKLKKANRDEKMNKFRRAVRHMKLSKKTGADVAKEEERAEKHLKAMKESRGQNKITWDDDTLGKKNDYKDDFPTKEYNLGDVRGWDVIINRRTKAMVLPRRS